MTNASGSRPPSHGPRMGAGMGQQLAQSMRMTPKLLQAIRLLELPAAELSTFLRESFEGNPAMTLTEPPPERERAPRPPRARAIEDGRGDWLEQTAAARSADALELVLEQLPFLDLDPEEERWVRFLALRLDARGLLSPSDAELLEEARAEGLCGGETGLGRGIAALQRLEPRGLGGRSAEEALLLQLDPGDPDYGRLCQLIEGYLDDVLANRLPRVARELGLELDGVLQLIQRLAALDPVPLSELGAADNHAIAPDLVLDGSDGGFELRLEANGLPEVGIDEDALSLAADRDQPAEVRRYVKRGIEAARQVLDGLSQRRQTLLRVARTTFQHQLPFLAKGPAAIRPLTMQAIAEELELHASTVSRAVAGKHVQTPYGVLPLRSFFQNQVSEGGGSQSALAAEIRAVVDAEDKRRPLSDDEIVAELARRGSACARRTVAKYRTELGIQSSYRRRRFDAAA